MTSGPALIPLAGPANRQGRIAADNIGGRASTYKGTQGTAVCKIFDLTVGITGMSEKALAKAGIPFEKVYVHPTSHAGYYPGAVGMTLKLLFAPDSGRILGAQAVGGEGVDKRIDVLAVALRRYDRDGYGRPGVVLRAAVRFCQGSGELRGFRRG